MNIHRPAPSAPTHIHVGRGKGDAWIVRQNPAQPALGTYRMRFQALAFARALAYSRGVDVIVHERNGTATRHRRASLTYPTNLD